MGIIIILFFIAIILAFIMLSYQAWEIKTLRTDKNNNEHRIMPEIYFRHLEKTALYLIKNIVQWVILMAVKYWYVSSTKTKKWINKNWPKIANFLKTKAKDIDFKKKFIYKKSYT